MKKCNVRLKIYLYEKYVWIWQKTDFIPVVPNIRLTKDWDFQYQASEGLMKNIHRQPISDHQIRGYKGILAQYWNKVGYWYRYQSDEVLTYVFLQRWKCGLFGILLQSTLTEEDTFNNRINSKHSCAVSDLPRWFLFLFFPLGIVHLWISIILGDQWKSMALPRIRFEIHCNLFIIPRIIILTKKSNCYWSHKFENR